MGLARLAPPQPTLKPTRTANPIRIATAATPTARPRQTPVRLRIGRRTGRRIARKIARKIAADRAPAASDGPSPERPVVTEQFTDRRGEPGGSDAGPGAARSADDGAPPQPGAGQSGGYTENPPAPRHSGHGTHQNHNAQNGPGPQGGHNNSHNNNGRRQQARTAGTAAATAAAAIRSGNTSQIRRTTGHPFQ